MSEITNSDINTAQNGLIGALPAGNLVTGELRVATVKTVQTGSITAGDTVGLVDLPEGAVFEAALSSVAAEDHGTAVRYSIIDGNGQVYFTNVDLSVADAGLISAISASTFTDATLLAASPITGSDTGLYLSSSLATTPTDGANATWKLAYRV